MGEYPAEPKNPSRLKRLKGVRFAAPMVLALVVTAAMMWQVHRLDARSLQQVKQAVQEQQLANVRNCQRSMAGLLLDCIQGLQQMAGLLPTQEPRRVREWARAMVEAPDRVYVAMCAWDSQGRCLWRTDWAYDVSPLDDWSRVDSETLANTFYSCPAVRTWEPQSRPDEPEQALVVVASRDGQNQVQGYLGAVIDMQRVVARTVHPLPSESNIQMRYWVLDGAGRILLYLAPPPKTTQAAFSPVANPTEQDRRKALRIGQVGWGAKGSAGVEEVEDSGENELVAYQGLRLGREQYLLAVSTPADAVAQTFRWHRFSTLSLMVGLAVLLGLAWWISRGLEAAQVRLRAEQRYVREIQQVQESLAVSERRYRDWFNNVPIGICRLALRPRGLVLWSNPALVQTLGCPAHLGLAGANLRDYFVHPEDLDRLYESLETTGLASSYQTALKRSDGRMVWVVITSIASHDEQGHVEHYGTLLEDVTQRKSAEDALQASQKHLQAVVGSAPVVLWTTDRQGTITFIEGAPLAANGHPISAAGSRVHDFQIDPSLAEDVLRRCLGGETFSFTSPHGDRWWETSVAPWHDENRQTAGIIGVSVDITGRRRAEEALDAQREQMELVFRHSSDGICIRHVTLKDFRRRMVVCNDRLVEMSGYSRQELMARYGQEKLLVHRNSDLERRQQREMILREQPVQGVDSWIRPDGKENYHEFTSVPIRVAPDQMLIVDIRRDITERLKTDAALKQAHRQLVSAREQERRRLARELHDSIGQGLVALQLAMRTSLTGSRGQLDKVSEARLWESMQQCSRLVGEIRQLCHGLYPPTLESLGLVAALQQLARSCRESAANVELQCDEPLHSRRFSHEIEITLFRIAQEAVSNALRHSRASKIDVALSLGDDGCLWLRVRDDGVGFDTAVSANGLGMVSMKERAQSVGGVLTVSTQPGSTCINAVVPVQEPSPPA